MNSNSRIVGLETRLQHNNFLYLKCQLGFYKVVMVEQIGLGGGLVLLAL